MGDEAGNSPKRASSSLHWCIGGVAARQAPENSIDRQELHIDRTQFGDIQAPICQSRSWSIEYLPLRILDFWQEYDVKSQPWKRGIGGERVGHETWTGANVPRFQPRQTWSTEDSQI